MILKGTIYSKLNDYSLEGDVISIYGYNNDLTVNYDNKRLQTPFIIWTMLIKRISIHFFR